MASDTTRSFRSLMIGGQHALAAVGGIIAAPLVIALGMGLSAADTRYVISAALVISGIATVIQILRIGPIGSGLLSIQGTSFAFVGPLIFVFSDLSADLSAQDALGVIFGSALVCSAAMILLAAYVDKLRSVVTSNVTGLTLLLIGLTLVEGTSRALWGAFNAAIVPWQFLLICSVTLLVLGLSLALPKLHLRWVAIILALAVGTGVATLFGEVDWRLLSADAIVFLPEFGRFGFSVDWMVVLILMPIFLVSATESIGDLTATNALSGYPTGDSAYWGRVRGGLMGDALNSGLASAFATFPNTTFSQNNGLIRLTGESRPHIGLYAATFIGVLGLIPLLSSAAQLIPAPVINVVTVILFAMVAWAGWQVFSRQADSLRSWIVFLGGAAGGYTLAAYAEAWTFLPEGLRQVVSFPVSTGAVLGLILEWLLPKGRHFRSS